MSNQSNISVFSPAKINLFLGVTGLLPNNFHHLVSLVTPVNFGDTIKITISNKDTFTCNDSSLPTDDTNLVIKAVQIFREAASIKTSFNINLNKKIPTGAGLGGGSSNGTFTLKALNKLFNNPLSHQDLHNLSAQLGSDCPLFLHDEPVIMTGRGDIIEKLPSYTLSKIRNIKLILFKPSTSINTGWAYGQLKENKAYINESSTRNKLNLLLKNIDEDKEIVLFNSFEEVILKKYLGLSVLKQELSRKYQLNSLVSGSGSTCFAILPSDFSLSSELISFLKETLGQDAFIEITQIK